MSGPPTPDTHIGMVKTENLPELQTIRMGYSVEKDQHYLLLFLSQQRVTAVDITPEQAKALQTTNFQIGVLRA